jgi:hypothetical protein
MNQTKVADLTVDQLKTLIRETVAETLAEMLQDPDEGLVLRQDFVVQLQKSLSEQEDDLVPAQEVAERLITAYR